MVDALSLVRRCAQLGADAFIIQDWGLFREIRRLMPQLETHISTQANIHDTRATAWCRDAGADRVTLAFLVDAYDEEVVGQDKNGKDDVRTVLRLHPALAPFKCAVLPLSKKEVLSGPAQQLRDELARDFMVDYDDTGSIGKR